MSIVPRVPGVERVLRIEAPSTLVGVFSLDNVFTMNNLSSGKFAPWLNMAGTQDKISVISKYGRLSRFIEDFNPSTPEGSLWFLGQTSAGSVYYLCTGSFLSDVNSSEVFGHSLISHGFNALSGNFIDRLGNINGTPFGVTYNNPGVIGKSAGFAAASNSYVSFVPISWLNSAPKVHISFLLKINPVTDVWLFDFGGAVCEFSSSWGDYISPNVFIGYCETDISSYASNDVFFVLDFVFDGTQNDVDINVQNHKRFKIYVNGNEIPYTMVSGSIPDKFYNYGAGPFTIGSFFGDGPTGIFDEFRIGLELPTEDDLLIRQEQWLNPLSFWTIQVQPLIFSIEKLDFAQWKIKGTGFKPELADPDCYVDGVALSIDSATDTEIIASGVPDLISQGKALSVVNSDLALDKAMIAKENYCLSLSPYKFGL